MTSNITFEELDLSRFNDFFSLLAGLNILFVGSTRFRNGLNTSILKVNSWIEPLFIDKFKTIENKLYVFDPSNSAALQALTKMAMKITIRLELDRVNLNKRAYEQTTNFTKSFQCIFFISAIYSISFLIFSGFQPSYQDTMCIYNTILFSNLTLIIIALAFLITFAESVGIYLPYEVTFAIFISFLLCAYIVNTSYAPFFLGAKYISFKLNVIIGIFIALSPYILHFTKVIYYVIKFFSLHAFVSLKYLLKLRRITSTMHDLAITQMENFAEQIERSLDDEPNVTQTS